MGTPQNTVETATQPGTDRDRILAWLLSLPALWVGTLLAALSVADGFRNCVLHSLDFQWSPARLLAQHIDPWATYLSGDPAHQILLNQVPNYLHELYVVMLPFGYLPLLPAKLIWAVANLVMVLLSCLCVARLYELDRRHTWLLTIIVLTGTPFRVTIGNGQVTALVLLCLALWALVQSRGGRGSLLGGAWAKYSVPPVLAVFLLLRRRWRLLLCSVIPPAVGFFFFYAWLPTPFWTLLVEPFRCATSNVSPGLANIMAVTEIALRRPPMLQPVPDAFYLAYRSAWMNAAPYVLAGLLAIAIAAFLFFRGREVDSRIQFACLTAASLLCFKHQIYDFLLLTFCLAVALKAERSSVRNLLLALIAYFWYLERFLHIRHWEFWPSVVMVSFAFLFALIAVTWRLRDPVRWQAEWRL